MNKTQKMLKILIVDDSPVARKILKSCMPDDQEYEIHEAGDGAKGLEKFKEINPDITFMDLTMPVMDGLQAMESIKKINSDAIIIVCTADIQEKSISKVMTSGALSLIKKPPSKKSVQEALVKAKEFLEI